MEKIDLIVKNKGEENATILDANFFNMLIEKINECVVEIKKLQEEIKSLKNSN